MREGRVLGALALAGALLASGGARAEATAEDAAMAETLFREGRALLEASRVAEACVKLDSSHRLDPKVGTLMNLAACHELEGRAASAWAEFLEAARLARVGKVRDPKALEEAARTRAAQLEPQVPRLLLQGIERWPATARITIDGRSVPLSVWLTPVPVDAGDRVIEIAAPDRVPVRLVASVARGGGTTRLLVPAPVHAAAAPRPAEAPSSPPPSPSPPAPRSSRWTEAPALTGAALFVVGAGLGTGFGLRAIALKNERDALCDAAGCGADGLAKQDDAKTAAWIATGGFAAAGVGAALAVFWVLSTPAAGPMSVACGPAGCAFGTRF